MFAPKDLFGLTSPNAHLVERQRLLSKVAFTFSCILAVFGVLIFFLLPGFSPAKVAHAVAVGLLYGISRLSRDPRYYNISAIGIVAVTLVCGFAATLTNGGLYGYVAPILITVPVAAALFLGGRATLLTTGAVFLAFLMMIILDSYGFVSPTAYSPKATSIATFVLLSTATAISAAGVGFFAFDSENKIQTLKNYQEELKYAAYHDALTGIANRKKLISHLDNCVDAQADTHPHICLIHVDLDNFKPINDRFGHPVGDAVLKETARILNEHCGSDDLVSRIGGDEFIMVKRSRQDICVDRIHEECTNIIAEIKQPMLVDDIECRISASIGFVAAETRTCTTLSLLKNGDIALYESKALGRGIATRFTSAMQQRIELRSELISQLDAAFLNGRISCMLQPQFCLNTGEILGLEALGRVQTSNGEILLPGEFLSMLEEIGRLGDFDIHVLRAALDALVALRASGQIIPNVSVNASSVSLRSGCYVETILTELSKRELSPKDIKVEILETVFLTDKDDIATQAIQSLSDANIATVLDDFGSANASISNLLRLNIDGFKIHKSMIVDVNNERSIRAMKAVLKLSEGLDITTVVEGVETPRQQAFVKSLGYGAVQGYGFCKPMTPKKLQHWLENYGSSKVNEMNKAIESAKIA